MTIEKRERLAKRVKIMKLKKGVAYVHLARQLGCSSQAIMMFANGQVMTLGDEKCQQLWVIIEPFFPEPKKVKDIDETK